MPQKRLHEQFDNDTGEGTSNIKKIRIVRGADGDSDNDSDPLFTCPRVPFICTAILWECSLMNP